MDARRHRSCSASSRECTTCQVSFRCSAVSKKAERGIAAEIRQHEEVAAIGCIDGSDGFQRCRRHRRVGEPGRQSADHLDAVRAGPACEARRSARCRSRRGSARPTDGMAMPPPAPRGWSRRVRRYGRRGRPTALVAPVTSARGSWKCASSSAASIGPISAARRSNENSAASQRPAPSEASVRQSWRNMMAASGPTSVAARGRTYCASSIGR